MSAAAVTAAPRVVLHVGTPKSGTTFLQKAMWGLRGELQEAGVLFPGEQLRDQFRAAIQIRQTHRTWGFTEDELEGTWERLAAEARAFPGTTVLSHELLAAATPDQVAHALASLEGVDVHIVVTVRDLARQVMSEWQERIKNGSSFSFDKFRRTVVRRRPDEQDESEERNLFWRYHDVVDVLGRWAADLPADHVHVVVAPPSGGDPLALWRLFGDAVGFDAAALTPRVESANTSLGVVQIAALRRLNKALDRRLPLAKYTRMVKRPLAQGFLAERHSPRPECPRRLAGELRSLAEQANGEIQRRRYVVHGDLADLLPVVPDEDRPHPDDVAAEELAAELATLMAEDLVLRARRTERVETERAVAAARPAEQTATASRRRLPGRRTAVRMATRARRVLGSTPDRPR